MCNKIKVDLKWEKVLFYMQMLETNNNFVIAISDFIENFNIFNVTFDKIPNFEFITQYEFNTAWL